MCSVGFPRLALFAESNLAIALDGEGGRLGCARNGKETVAVIVRRRTGRREDGRCV
jgi:hypothetical protein